MKTICVALLALALPAQAVAASRLYSTKMSCAEAKSLIRSEGAAVLHWQSQRVSGLPRYDRFVRDSNFCEVNFYAAPATAPTADDPQCLLFHCEQRLNDPGDRILVPG